MARIDLSTLVIAGKVMRTTDIGQTVSGVRLDRRVGALPELELTLIDASNILTSSGLTAEGTKVTLSGIAWVVAAVTRAYPVSGPDMVTVTCRGPLARKLRSTYKSSVEQKVDAARWVRTRVDDAGGKAICMPTSARATIAQSGGDRAQSQLDVISQLAGQIDGSFVERDGNKLWFGTAEWAFATAPPGQKSWTLDRANVSGEFSVDSDDTEAIASGSLIVPIDIAERMQPWDLVQATGFGPDSGRWLVGDLSIDDTATVTVPVSRPRPPRKKSGSKK